MEIIIHCIMNISQLNLFIYGMISCVYTALYEVQRFISYTNLNHFWFYLSISIVLYLFVILYFMFYPGTY